MVCPFCSSPDTSVKNSRVKAKGSRVWRRRSCSYCQKTFTTNEIPDYSQLHVIKRNGRTEAFMYPKLFISIWRACEPLKGSYETSEALTSTVIEQLLRVSELDALSSELISDVTTKTLQRFNSSAFVRYLSFQTNIGTPTELRRALKFYRDPSP